MKEGNNWIISSGCRYSSWLQTLGAASAVVFAACAPRVWGSVSWSWGSFWADFLLSADKVRWFRVLLWQWWTEPVMCHHRRQGVSQEFVPHQPGCGPQHCSEMPCWKGQRRPQAMDTVGTQPTDIYTFSNQLSLLCTSFPAYMHIQLVSQSSTSYSTTFYSWFWVYKMLLLRVNKCINALQDYILNISLCVWMREIQFQFWEGQRVIASVTKRPGHSSPPPFPPSVTPSTSHPSPIDSRSFVFWSGAKIAAIINNNRARPQLQWMITRSQISWFERNE